MTENEFKTITKAFALRVIEFVDALPLDRASSHLGRQLLRSGTSVGANYRAACRAKSKADMVAKLAIVEEEADESQFWLELLSESGRVKPGRVDELHQEAGRILSMTVASIKTLKAAR